jgi:hypothetical protein
MFFAQPASADPAPPKPGWLIFSSSEAFPPPPVPFSVHYPAGFQKDGGTGSLETPSAHDRIAGDGQNAVANAIVQSFRFRDPENGRQVFMNIVTSVWSEEERLMVEKDGFPALWETMGRGMAEAFGATFDGARHFLHSGLQAADMFFSRETKSDSGKEYSTLGAHRMVTKEAHGVTLSCYITVNLADAKAEGFTSRDNPASSEYCTPFFDSLTFD